MMKVEHMQPFMNAANSVLGMMLGKNPTPGKPYVKSTKFQEDHIVISIGVTGQLKGLVLLSFSIETACDIASKMCMMPINQLDDISVSALCELGNMILGNAATDLSTKDIIVDITPPSIIRGFFSMDSAYAENICIPLTYDNNLIELDIAIKEKE